MKKLILILAIFSALGTTTVLAHSGGLDENGCHKNPEGEYHCH